MNELLIGLTSQALTLLRLREERNDGSTRVTTDNRDDGVLRVAAGDLGEETSRTDDVKGGDTEDTTGVVDTGFFEDSRDDGDCAVDGV